MQLSASFVALPALSRVLPVSTSGPVSRTMRWSHPSGDSMGTHATKAVVAPHAFARRTAPRGYGVVPPAAIPTTVSSGPIARRSISARAPSHSSSRPSLERRSAPSPPAITPTTWPGSLMKVGGHSLASSTPSRPLVPAPK